MFLHDSHPMGHTDTVTWWLDSVNLFTKFGSLSEFQLNRMWQGLTESTMGTLKVESISLYKKHLSSVYDK